VKRFLKVGLVLVLSIGVVGALAGCTNYEKLATDAATGHFEQRGFQGEVENSEAEHIKAATDGEPTNHEVMSMFILSQAGYDSDLSSYDRVDLVTMTLADGSEVKAVVLDEGDNVVFPQSVESGQ